MIEEGILDGDYVVIEQRDSANNGEIVVALVRNEEVSSSQNKGVGDVSKSLIFVTDPFNFNILVL
jgi:hypothetical protein